MVMLSTRSMIWAIWTLHSIVSSETRFETWWWPSSRAETCCLSNKYSTTLLVVYWLYYLHHLITQISKLMQIRPVGAELFHEDGWTDGWIDGQTDRQTDRHDEANSRLRNFAKAPNKHVVAYCSLYGHSFESWCLHLLFCQMLQKGWHFNNYCVDRISDLILSCTGTVLWQRILRDNRPWYYKYQYVDGFWISVGTRYLLMTEAHYRVGGVTLTRKRKQCLPTGQGSECIRAKYGQWADVWKA